MLFREKSMSRRNKIVQISNFKSLQKKWGGGLGHPKRPASDGLKQKMNHQNVWWKLQSRKVTSRIQLPIYFRPKLHLKLLYIFCIYLKGVVHHSTRLTCMLLHCSISQSELYAAEAKKIPSCLLAEQSPWADFNFQTTHTNHIAICFFTLAEMLQKLSTIKLQSYSAESLLFKPVVTEHLINTRDCDFCNSTGSMVALLQLLLT